MPETRPRLHIGCGQVALDGWVNIDNQHYPGVDHVLDVSLGLPFADAEYIFAEHFIEHLSFDDGLSFLRECRRVLAPDGVLRLSTPNLDWVHITNYRLSEWKSGDEALRDCFTINRAFRAWGHQFLYNGPTLAATLRRAGFRDTLSRSYGESNHQPLRGLERHETWGDTRELPHVLVVEASGIAEPHESLLEASIADYRIAIDVV